ncbi:trypsin-like serine peptidase [Streptomyces gamaensis]|uniref:Trypsin-like serine peptidase n=1 Tax=Streptomyces gamaensis TaxID=1763542 RepID=A0ABW0Z2R5_9ACTN
MPPRNRPPAARRRRPRPVRTAALVAALLALVPCAGCVQAGGARPAAAAAASGTWPRSRLLKADPLGRHPGVSHPARPSPSSARVGALFERDRRGDHFCTASVVASPGRSLLITAAHCVHGGSGGDYHQDIVFAPAYRNGQTPDGIWEPAALVVDRRWAASGDPDLDVAFIVLRPRDGRRIADVLGANRLATGRGFVRTARVTGYPRSGSDPITCINTTARHSARQLRIACTGYSGGTSGSPWITDFDPERHTGSVIGVIGGYQQGGATDDVSYSPYFGEAVARLYRQAVAKES